MENLNIEEKLLYYMDELNKSMNKQIKLHEEYNAIEDLAKRARDIAILWRKRAIDAEKALEFNSNVLNKQN